MRIKGGIIRSMETGAGAGRDETENAARKGQAEVVTILLNFLNFVSKIVMIGVYFTKGGSICD